MLDHPPPWLTAQLLVNIAVILIVVHVILVGCAFCIYLERKISAYIQDRIGPNRTGFDFGIPQLSFMKGMWGLGQSLADGLKFLLKEDYRPKGSDRWLFSLGPIAVIIPALIGFAVIPWGGVWNCPDFTIPILDWEIAGGPVNVAGAAVNVGIIYLIAVASLSIYGITLGGWASNNKYSFFGALRSSAQMISYEIPMGLSLLAVLLVTGTLIPEKIIQHQVNGGWLLLSQPLAAAIFFTCALAETNRAPFDNAECEQELVAGFHTEYSAMRYALYPLSEYAHMITSCAFFTLLFLGGYHLPLVFDGHPLSPEATGLFAVLLKFVVYFTKVVLLVCFMMLIRWSLPRMRFDQVMQLNWQGVIPVSMILIVATSVMVYFGQTSLLPMLGMNVVLGLVFLALMPMIPRSTVSKRTRMAGSRFFPVLDGGNGREGAAVSSDPLALEDRPEATAGMGMAAR